MNRLRTLLHLAVALLALLALGQPAAAQPLPLFQGLHLITWDSHVHPGNAKAVNCLDEPDFDLNVGCHQMRWCEDVYNQARAQGLRAMVASHHSDIIHLQTDHPDVTNWKSKGNGGWTDPYGNFWPTHSQGFPLLKSGGHSDVEVTALFECAEAANVPGEFLAFYGIEYTTSGPNGTAEGSDGLPCNTGPKGQGRCGGHKTSLVLSLPNITCRDGGAAAEGPCEDEGELYDFLDNFNGVAFAAHPSGGLPAEWVEYDASTARGGASMQHIYAFEFIPLNEDVPCVDTTERCGWRQVLALGWNLVPTRGSDNHTCPLAFDPVNCGAGFFETLGTSWRGVCLSDEFTRASFVDAIKARRCYWADSGEPLVHVTLEGVAYGRSVVPDGDLDYELYVERGGLDDPLVEWQIGCGDTTGGDGNYAVQASGSCTPETCDASGSFDGTGLEWCYLRIENSANTVIVATAPVILRTGELIPALPRWWLPVAALLLLLVALRRRAVPSQSPS